MVTRQLDGLPSLLPRYPRAVAPLVPFADRLPGIPGHGDALPAVELAVDGVAIDAARLATYREVCGSSGAATLPATYPHVLAFPLHMTLMTDGAFPYAPMGLVHIANAIEQHRPIDAGAALDLRVHARPGPAHARGRTFAIVTQAYVDGALVWEGRSTMLRPGGGEGPRVAASPAPEPLGDPVDTWALPDDLGRRYGAVSGDRNPIHLHPLTARLFGFPRAIAHGMWTKARCLAAIEAELPGAFGAQVRFRAPILLPSRVAFATGGTAGGGRRFCVCDAASGRAHLEGDIVPLAEPGTSQRSTP
jgi:acyl dehydratase